MRADFYHITCQDRLSIAASLAELCLKQDHKLLILAQPERYGDVSKALWSHNDQSFLAHDLQGSINMAIQPILIGELPQADNGARYAMIIDGHWREELLQMERVFYLFDAQIIDDARKLWRKFTAIGQIACHYWRQQGRKWVEGP